MLTIYGGLSVIFLIYSIMWIELFKNFYKILKTKNNVYYFFIFFFTFLYYFLNLKIFNLKFFFTVTSYINFYYYNSKNIIKELEILGWGLVYYSNFIFLIISYFLFLNCLVVIIIINNSKKIKNNILNNYFLYIFKNKKLFFLNIIKNQYFFIQDYENIYQKNTLFKNYRINNFYHQLNNIKRRV